VAVKGMSSKVLTLVTALLGDTRHSSKGVVLACAANQLPCCVLHRSPTRCGVVKPRLATCATGCTSRLCCVQGAACLPPAPRLYMYSAGWAHPPG
jgi:hypothetical protein